MRRPKKGKKKGKKNKKDKAMNAAGHVSVTFYQYHKRIKYWMVREIGVCSKQGHRQCIENTNYQQARW